MIQIEREGDVYILKWSKFRAVYVQTSDKRWLMSAQQQMGSEWEGIDDNDIENITNALGDILIELLKSYMAFERGEGAFSLN